MRLHSHILDSSSQSKNRLNAETLRFAGETEPLRTGNIRTLERAPALMFGFLGVVRFFTELSLCLRKLR